MTIDTQKTREQADSAARLDDVIVLHTQVTNLCQEVDDLRATIQQIAKTVRFRAAGECGPAAFEREVAALVSASSEA